jgi:DNA invertase Pin-like site-specific DNA recombinase
MVADLVWNGAKTILVESFDRFTRDVSAGMQLVYYLAAKELNLINCANNANVTQDVNAHPLQKGMVGFMALIAEIEKNLSVYRMRQGRDIKSRERGHRIEGPRSQYSRKFRDSLKRLHRNRSWSQVAKYLNDKNETTCNGEPWTGPRASAAARGGRKAV